MKPKWIIFIVLIVGFLFACLFHHYTLRGETVYEESKSFSDERSRTARFSFSLEQGDYLYRIHLTQKVLGSSYNYVLATRLISPSGVEKHREIMQESRRSSPGAQNPSAIVSNFLFEISPEPGRYTLVVSGKDGMQISRYLGKVTLLVKRIKANK